MRKETLRLRRFTTVLLGLVVALGIFLRFYNIDKREYWCDESYTSLSISGHSETELYKLFDGHLIHARDLSKFQTPSAPLAGTISELVGIGGQHPPLYYLLARLWAECFGSGVKAMRCLPALIGLLLLPAVYLLCMELFESTLAAGIALTIVAVSPFEVLFSQDAREYSLWAVMITLSSALLLRAMRTGSGRLWNGYCLVTALSLYTQPLSVFVVVAQTIFLLVEEKFRINSSVRMHLKSVVMAGLLFLPWVLAMISHHEAGMSNMDWVASAIPFDLLKYRWMHNVVRLFFDIPISLVTDRVLETRIFLTILCANFFFFFYAPSRQRTFVASLMLCTILPFLVPDLVWGGIRTTVLRYLTPFNLGIQFAVTFAFLKMIGSDSPWAKWIGVVALVSFVVIEATTCIWTSTLPVRDSFVIDGQNLRAVAGIVNGSDKPLIICRAQQNIGQLLALSNQLKPNTELVLFPNELPEMLPKYEQAFLYSPRSLPISSAGQYRLRRLDRFHDFWDCVVGPSRAPYFWEMSTISGADKNALHASE